MTSDFELPENLEPGQLHAGADNLLLECLQIKAGDSLLLVLEPDESLYENVVGKVIEARALHHGMTVQTVTEQLITKPDEFPQSISIHMRTADHTLFLSRVGDYVRFVALPGTGTKTTSYALSAAMLASPYATVSNNLMATLRDKLEAELLQADRWRIRCPLGTDLSGNFSWPSLNGNDDDEFQVALFPVSTFKPVPCNTATGRVALSRWLMPGAAAKIENADLTLSETVFCNVVDGQITGFDGPQDVVAQVSAHYDRVASTLNINRNRVHSWHAGMNPLTYFDKNAEDDIERWCAVSFGSPRYLHIHTCGDEPPGEATWSLFDPTIIIDDRPFWANGDFIWLRRPDNKALISATPDASVLLSGSRNIGIT